MDGGLTTVLPQQAPKVDLPIRRWHSRPTVHKSDRRERAADEKKPLSWAVRRPLGELNWVAIQRADFAATFKLLLIALYLSKKSQIHQLKVDLISSLASRHLA